jgi:hypothetical protein
MRCVQLFVQGPNELTSLGFSHGQYPKSVMEGKMFDLTTSPEMHNVDIHESDVPMSSASLARATQDRVSSTLLAETMELIWLDQSLAELVITGGKGWIKTLASRLAVDISDFKNMTKAYGIDAIREMAKSHPAGQAVSDVDRNGIDHFVMDTNSTCGTCNCGTNTTCGTCNCGTNSTCGTCIC